MRCPYGVLGTTEQAGANVAPSQALIALPRLIN